MLAGQDSMEEVVKEVPEAEEEEAVDDEEEEAEKDEEEKKNEWPQILFA